MPQIQRSRMRERDVPQYTFRGKTGSHRARGSFRGGGKLARSGIKTRSGYRKFDSQRVKGPTESGDEPEEVVVVEEEQTEGLSEDEEDAIKPNRMKAYHMLMQSFRQPDDHDGTRKRKRRRIELEKVAENFEADHFLDGDHDLEANTEPDEDAEYEDGTVEADDRADLDADGDEREVDQLDSFEVHFAQPDDNELLRRLKSIQASDWRTDTQPVPTIGTFTVSAPKSVLGNLVRKPTIMTTPDMHLKKRIKETAHKHLPVLDKPQQVIAPYILSYTDLLLGNRSPQNASSLRSLACLHALNHVLKGRDKVLKNTARLAQADNPEMLDLRDQGFTRPKVLILTETRQMAARYADTIVKLFAPEQQKNRKRFDDSFSALVDDHDNMPEDYRELFDGNNDNAFLTALKFTRKTLKFFSAFYSSDVILASPLGLRRIIENEDSKKRDWDFLSSIEVCIVDQADAMQMQNWENVEVVFRHLNLEPKDAHGCDFSRVRSWYLDGHARYLRQTIVFSAYITPEMNRVFNTSMQNVAGKVKLTPTYSSGALMEMGGLGVKQTFSRFDSPSHVTDPDARFKFFTSAVLPTILRLPKPVDGAQGILIFIPSYYDFIRIRNFFATSTMTQNISFGTIHDYSPVSDQRRARSHFLSGRHSILLYTQRAHHFFRLRIRGVKRVVLYAVPDNPIFYRELGAGFLGTSIDEGQTAPEEGGLRCVVSKWDLLRLERVVGSDRVKGMLGGVGDTIDFI